MDEVISVLIGLAGACANNPKTDGTDGLLIRALAFDPAKGETERERLIEELRAEKNRIAPNCATCPNPCGNTSDYDMSRIEAAEEEVKLLKRQIIDQLRKTAIAAREKELCLDENATELLYRGLSFVSYDLTAERLKDLLEKLQNVR